MADWQHTAKKHDFNPRSETEHALQELGNGCITGGSEKKSNMRNTQRTERRESAERRTCLSFANKAATKCSRKEYKQCSTVLAVPSSLSFSQETLRVDVTKSLRRPFALSSFVVVMTNVSAEVCHAA